MIRRSLLCRLYGFCSKKSPIEPSSTFLTEAEKLETAKVPVHLRTYDKRKFETPSKKIKKNSGYAMVQIEPFPRARIMKICYNILADVKKGIPEDYIYRILTEEKIKYIMNLVDTEEDVQQLQKMFGGIEIQIFIRNLANQFEVIESMRRLKAWEMNEEEIEQAERNFVDNFKIHDQPKFPTYRRPERTKYTLL